MGFVRPSVSAFKAQFRRDFPYAVPAYGAAGTVTKVNGVITAIAVALAGFGYQSAPTVTVEDPTGTGATVTATVAGGKVTGFVVGAGGTGYSAPTLVITGGSGSETNLDLVIDEDIVGAQLDASFNMNE